MTDSLPPHPVLEKYYGDAGRRERFVRDIFDDTAEWYDDITSMLSFGTADRYRREALARGGLRNGTRLLDLATGTGVLARAAATVTSSLICTDASLGMLLAGRYKTGRPIVQSRGESLPFRDASFDMITIGYALRHFADLRRLFEGVHRALAPGGRLLILEITPPRSRVGFALLRFHLNRVVPLLAGMKSGNARARELMHYYWDTIEQCVPPETIMNALSAAGFESVGRHVELGTFSEYSGVRGGG